MLVGAGEVDAALLVVAADDGPRAQTLEHLELLDALGIGDGVVAVTKSDLVPAERTAEVIEAVARLLGGTRLAESRSWRQRDDRLAGRPSPGGPRGLRDRCGGHAGERDRPRLATDRVFAVRGRGTVVTGTLRNGTVRQGAAPAACPAEQMCGYGEVQVRGETVAAAGHGRAALLVGGIEAASLRRGQVLADDAAVVTTSACSSRSAPAAALSVHARGAAGACRPPIASGSGSTSEPSRPARWWCAGRASPSTSRTGLRWRCCGSTPRLRRPRATGSPFDVRRRARPRAAAWCWTRRHHEGSPPAADRAARPGAGLGHERPAPTAGPVPRPGSSFTARSAPQPLGRSPRTLVPPRRAAVPWSRRTTGRAGVAGDRRGRGAPGLAVATRRLVTADRRGSTTRSRVPSWTGWWPAGRWRATATGSGTRPGPPAFHPRRWPRWTASRPRSTSPRPHPSRTRRALRLSARRGAGARGGSTDRAARGRPRVGRDALPRPGRTCAGDGGHRSRDPRGVPRRDGTSRRYVLVILEDLDRRGLLRRTDAGHVLGPVALARARERMAADGQGTSPTEPPPVADIASGGPE